MGETELNPSDFITKLLWLAFGSKQFDPGGGPLGAALTALDLVSSECLLRDF